VPASASWSGVAETDTERDADYLAEKILKLRVFQR